MKKSIIILAIALILIVASVYTVGKYNANSITAKNPEQQEQQSVQDPASTPTPAPEQSADNDTEQSDDNNVEQSGDSNAEQSGNSDTEESGDNDAEQSSSQPEDQRVNLIRDYDFTLEDLDGNNVSLSDFKGKKIFINFWATWCPPCKAEMPDMEKLYQETKDSDLVILAVNIGDDKKTVQEFTTKNEYNFKVLLDLDAKVGRLYQASSIPTSYFVDTEGYLNNGIVGPMSLDTMKEYVNNLK